MKLWLGEEEIDPRLVATNSGLNFGRFPEGRALRGYELVVGFEELGWLAQEWAEVALEMKDDDLLENEPSPYHLVDYDPELNRALKNPEALIAIVDFFFARRILERFVPDGDRRDWVINSAEEAATRGDALVIRGRCFACLG